MQAFNFIPMLYTSQYKSQGYVHIEGGIDTNFIQFLKKYLQNLMHKRGKFIKDWEIKNEKQQLLFDFSENSDLFKEICEKVALVAGWSAERIKLAESHFKVYEQSADPDPPAHKDRLASEITVGIPLSIPKDSEIYLYPNHCRDVNPFVSWAEMRNNLDEEDLPENYLRGATPVRLHAQAGDVVAFAGSSIYHKRVNGAGATILYLKFNFLGLDPIAEDPRTLVQRRRSLEILQGSSDEKLLESMVDVSPRLHRISRHYTRLAWKEIIQAYVWGEKEFILSETELSLIKRLEGPSKVKSWLTICGISPQDLTSYVSSIRRLAKLSAIDLLD